MEYKCKTIEMSRMIVTTKGFFSPLCERCQSQDCTNPIETTEVSILGVVKKIRVYNRGNSPRFVVQCEGFLP